MNEDLQLKLALVRMLPEKIEVLAYNVVFLVWSDTDIDIKETEWLHVCWLVEQSLLPDEQTMYVFELEEYDGGRYKFECINAPWQLRAKALCKVKGIEI